MDLQGQNIIGDRNRSILYIPLMPTTLTPCSSAHRKTSRPIRPNPLIPILTSDEDMFTTKKTSSLDYSVREEKKKRDTNRATSL